MWSMKIRRTHVHHCLIKQIVDLPDESNKNMHITEMRQNCHVYVKTSRSIIHYQFNEIKTFNVAGKIAL